MADRIVELLEKEIEEVSMHKINLEQALAECNRELKRLDKTLNTYVGSSPKAAKKKRQANGESKPPQGVDRILEVMGRFPDQEWSAPMLLEHVEISPSTVNKILVHLRETGKIDLTRKGGTRGVTKFYKVALAERVSDE